MISFVLVPPGPVTVNVAVYIPGIMYECDVFLALLVCPSPKFHGCDEMGPVELLLKWTNKGAFPDLRFTVAFAIGAGYAATII